MQPSTSTTVKTWYPLWALMSTLLLILILNPLLRHGMFLDGVIYAAVAKNLSLNHGTLWQPFYSETLYPHFYEHPPFAIYLESLLFRALGEHSRVENLYCFLMILGQLSLISWYWVKKEKLAFYHLGILLLIWLMVPLNTRILTSNMLESTLTLFTTAASLLLLWDTKHKWAGAICLFLASIAILLGVLSNGPTAFFPVVIPLLKAITLGKPGDRMPGLKKTAWILFMTILVFTAFYLSVPAAWQNMKQYLGSQLLPSVVGARIPIYTGLKHLHIIFLYIRAISIVSFFSIICLITAAILQKQPIWQCIKQRTSNTTFLLFWGISLMASLPVGISHRQAFSYITQCAPFITLACTYLCYQPCLFIINHFASRRIAMRILQIGSTLIFIGAMIISTRSCTQFNRDEILLKDIQVLIPFLQDTSIISSSKQIYDQDLTAAYLARFSMISVEPSQKQAYYLALKNEPIPPGYQPINLPLAYYSLSLRS